MKSLSYNNYIYFHPEKGTPFGQNLAIQSIIGCTSPTPPGDFVIPLSDIFISLLSFIQIFLLIKHKTCGLALALLVSTFFFLSGVHVCSVNWIEMKLSCNNVYIKNKLMREYYTVCEPCIDFILSTANNRYRAQASSNGHFI